MDRRISKELIPDGRAADQPDSDFDPKQLAQGIKVEMEHTKNKALAKEIAKDHLAEIPDYYTKLIEMEKKATKRPEIIESLKRVVKREHWADHDMEYPYLLGDTWVFNIDRFRRHDHGGGDDGDGWLPHHEIEKDFREGKTKHRLQLDLVNKMLEDAGYEPDAYFELGEKGHFSILFQLKDGDTKKVKKMLKASDLEPEKINLKERWRNKEWNKLDGAPEEDVLTQPLRSRHDYGESMKVSKKLRKVASYLKTALDDQSPEALHFSLNHDDEEEDFLHSASLRFGQDWERVWKPAWYTVALTTSTAPHSSEGKKFLKETGAHVEKQGGRFLYYLK